MATTKKRKTTRPRIQPIRITINPADLAGEARRLGLTPAALRDRLRRRLRLSRSR